MSCIPGSVGGGIRMNSGCFEKEFKDILISIQLVDFDGVVKSIPANKINFNYRSIGLSKDLIFLSATFKGKKKNSLDIDKYMKEINKKKIKLNLAKLKLAEVHLKIQLSKLIKKHGN